MSSDEWKRRGIGTIRFIPDLFKRGQLGLTNGPSDVGFVYKAKLPKFADSCMMVSLSLARATEVTGLRNPHDRIQKQVLKEKKH